MELKEGRQCELSLYDDKIAQPKTVAEQVLKLKLAFPTITKDYADILSERIYANGFTENRVKDAVSYVLDNFRYKQPAIADVISFDKRITVYSYSQILEKLIEVGPSVWKDYKPVKMPRFKNTVYINIAEADAVDLRYELIEVK